MTELEKVQRALFQASLYEFVIGFWETVNTERFIDAPHIRLVCDEVQEIALRAIRREAKLMDALFVQPPRTTKTMLYEIMLNAWAWSIDSSVKFIVASYSAKLALESAQKTRQIILSEKYQRLFPEVKLQADAQALGNYSTTKNGMRISTSPGGTLLGDHALILVFGDIMSATEASSEAERNSVIDWYKNTFSRCKVSNENSVIIGSSQRLNQFDLIGTLLASGKPYHYRCLPAEISQLASWPEIYQDGLLDPVNLSRKILADKLLEMGPFNYAAQYQGEPEDSSNAIIQRDWVPILDPIETEKEIKGCTVHMIIDGALTDNKKNDATAMGAFVVKDGKVICLEMLAVHEEFIVLVETIKRFAERHGVTKRSKMIIEDKANGSPLISTLKAFFNTVPLKSTLSKLTRLMAVQNIIYAKKFCIVRGDWNKGFLDELTMNNPRTDDKRDIAVWSLEELYQKNDYPPAWQTLRVYSIPSGRGSSYFGSDGRRNY
jgi:predicted phage terminase large subunit-like protein